MKSRMMAWIVSAAVGMAMLVPGMAAAHSRVVVVPAAMTVMPVRPMPKQKLKRIKRERKLERKRMKLVKRERKIERRERRIELRDRR
jgi:hypothetical protein